jgi:hypothetical protein
MKIKFIVIALIVSGTHLQGQLLTGRLTTSFYGWQGRDANNAKLNFLRGYENIQFDANQGMFSFGTNLQVSNDFVAKIGTDPELRLSSLVFRARRIANMVDVSVGRQFIFAGVGNGLMDGADLKLSVLNGKLGAQFYGGYNVVESRTLSWKKSLPDNAFYGVQITGSPIDDLLLGVSYMNRTRTPDAFTVVRLDSLFNPYLVTLYYTPYEEEYASFDAQYALLANVSVYGRGDYDVNLERLSRAELSARVGVLQSLFVTGEFLHREPRLAYNSIFAVFNNYSTQEVEGGVEYDIAPTFRTFARYAFVNYKDDNSQRITFGGSYEFLSASFTRNIGFAGDLNGVALQAAYPLQDRTLIPMVGVGYGSYKISPDDPTNTVINGSIGLTYRPMQSLSADIQTQVMQNRLYNNDVRIFLKVNYWFSAKLN